MKIRQTIYAQVDTEGVRMRVVGTGESVALACEALAHPRTLMGDYGEIERLFRRSILQLRSQRRMLLKPKMLIHLIPTVEGGYTDAERDAFRNAGIAAGTSEAWILTDYDAVPDDHIEQLFDGPFGMSLIPAAIREYDQEKKSR